MLHLLVYYMFISGPLSTPTISRKRHDESQADYVGSDSDTDESANTGGTGISLGPSFNLSSNN